jgi:DNA-binding winged-HTH domains
MQAEQLFGFGSYRLDPAHGQLWRGQHEVKVTPKALAVLCCLVARPGQVVTKGELFAAIWPQRKKRKKGSEGSESFSFLFFCPPVSSVSLVLHSLLLASKPFQLGAALLERRLNIVRRLP